MKKSLFVLAAAALLGASVPMFARSSSAVLGALFDDADATETINIPAGWQCVVHYGGQLINHSNVGGTANTKTVGLEYRHRCR